MRLSCGIWGPQEGTGCLEAGAQNTERGGRVPQADGMAASCVLLLPQPDFRPLRGWAHGALEGCPILCDTHSEIQASHSHVNFGRFRSACTQALELFRRNGVFPMTKM